MIRIKETEIIPFLKTAQTGYTKMISEGDLEMEVELAEKVEEALTQAMLSYMGWFTCTDTYDCYQSRIKPYIHVGRLKKIISKIKRRQNHEGMDQGKMLRGAAGAAACG